MKRILVGMDGSARANALLREALSFAREVHGQLVLVQVVDLPKNFPVEAYSLAPKEVERLLQLRARVLLEGFARDIPSDFSAGICVETGVPWQAICRCAQREDVDLIFLGTHGNDASDRLLGTTASKVANNADRPVLIYRHISVNQKRVASATPTEVRYDGF